MHVGDDLPHDGLVVHISREQPYRATVVYQPQDKTLHLFDIGSMQFICSPTVVVSAMVVHNANADGPGNDWDTTRCRKRECKIGINGVTPSIEAHLPHRIP